MPFVRYKLTIAYRGTNYHGWQQQPALESYKGEAPAEGSGIPTVQETISAALAQVLGHPVSLVGSSRTDAGVHAKGQVAHFDTDQTQIPIWGLHQAVNHRLPPDMLIRRLVPAPEGFDAITSTIAKRYQYAVWATDFRNPFANDLLWHRWQKIDHEAMAAAAAHFVGRHDLASFARPGHNRLSTVRTILACDVSRRGPLIVIGVTGTGFLWNMVRIMVGTLVEIGIGRRSPDVIPAMLQARDRNAAGPTAPPHGLYLQWIKFQPPTSKPAGPASASTPIAPPEVDDDSE
jgi:tRNA pseudouridine38-40 synthase